MEKFDKLFREAVGNIRGDRDTANAALDEIVQDVHQGKTTHHQSGMVIAKYLETLQRSNEQLVKLLSLKNKTRQQTERISTEEIENIYSKISSEHDA